jgi:hypothetical protein
MRAGKNFSSNSSKARRTSATRPPSSNASSVAVGLYGFSYPKAEILLRQRQVFAAHCAISGVGSASHRLERKLRKASHSHCPADRQKAYGNLDYNYDKQHGFADSAVADP